MNIFDFFFSIFREVINLYDVDFFGFGFSWLSFVLGGLIIIFVIKFIIGSFRASNNFDFFSLTGLSNNTSMSNREREKDMVTYFYGHNLDTDKVSVRKRTVSRTSDNVRIVEDEYTNNV